MSMNLNDIVANINWEELRDQKLWLQSSNDVEAEGILCLLDQIQDAAVELGIATFQEVFDIDLDDE